MKVLASRPGQGANRSEGWPPSQGLQRRHGCEDALSCFDIFGLQYQGLFTFKREMRWPACRTAARRTALSNSIAICKPPDKADAGRQANPEGKMNAGRIAALRLACVAVLHGTHRALHCIPAFIFRTPV